MSATTAKKSYAHASKGDVVDGGSGPTPRSLAKAFAEIVPAEQLVEVHSLVPWWIMQCKPNCERIASDALLREGFEAWYPTRRVFSPIPQRKLPSKTRHKRRHEAVKATIECLYPGYVFVRRLLGTFNLLDVSELDGCVGMCFDPEPAEGYRCASAVDGPSDGPIGYHFATVPDHLIETFRLAEAKGSHDVYNGVSAFKAFTADVRYDAKALKQYHSTGRVVARLDESVGASLFIAHLDRIVRVSRILDRAAPSGPIMGGTTPRVDCVPSADG